MLNATHVAHLLALQTLVLINAERYSHTFFKSGDGSVMCALGMAVEAKEVTFPQLPLEFAGADHPHLADVGYDIRPTNGAKNCSTVAEQFFGPGSWERIFGFAAYENEATAAMVADRIAEFIEAGTKQCATQQPVECGRPTEPVARN